ncbi:MAG: hypothetical protein ACRDOI_22730 [Trebonia sp.]
MHLKDDELVTGLAGQEGGLDLLAAVYARVPTAVGFTRMLSPLGNYFIARPAARAAAKTITAETDVPLDAAVVLGLTRDALHVWSADPMLDQVHEYLGQVSVDRIAALTATPGRSWQKLAITLDGGHEIDIEARAASHIMASAFDRLKGTAATQ